MQRVVRHLREMLGQMSGVEFVAGPAHAHEASEVEQFLPILPGQDRLQRIGAGDEVQLRVRQLLPQIAQRVDGVGVAVPVDVDATHAELRIRRRRDDRHQVPVLGRTHRRVLAQLLPRAPGRDEDHLIQFKAMSDLARRHQVPVVDRVERATHHADAARTVAVG